MRTVEEIARACWRAEGERDLTAMLDCLSPDVVWQAAGMEVRGHEQIAAYHEGAVAAYPQVEIDVGRAFGGPDEAAIEWSAVFVDPAGGRHPASGINVLRRDGDRIVSVTSYFDPSLLTPSTGTSR